MSTSRALELSRIRSHSGRCPWKFEYQVDDLPVSAFFRPPEQLGQLDVDEVSLVALPILCDLAAEVRPKSVRIRAGCKAPSYQGIFRDATSALLMEQDYSCGRRDWTLTPRLEGTFMRRARSNRHLSRARVVLGFSGGKDSIVSLFVLLEAGYEVTPVLLNEGDRSWQDIRRWIPKLKRLGLAPIIGYIALGRRMPLRDRYGEWHASSYQIGWLTALLALCAEKAGAAIIALGIESSPDLTYIRYHDKFINHQHQKTTRHLLALEKFYRRVVNDQLRIASPIAPFSDTEVIRVLLGHVPNPYQAFSSCGSANSVSKHCGKCEKCAFVYVLLSASREGRKLARRVFRSDLLDDVSLYRPWLDRRYKPRLGCIGERGEVWRALESLLKNGAGQTVVQHWRNSSFRKADYPNWSHRPRPCTLNRELAKPLRKASNIMAQWLNEA